MIKLKYILLTIAALALIGFFYYLSRKKSLSFDFDLGGNLSSLLGLVTGRYANPNAKGVGAYVEVPITTKITNNKKAATILKDLSGYISYNGEPIIQTKIGSPALQNINVTGKATTPITDNIQLLINSASIKFLTDLINNKNPQIKYNFSTIIGGKPHSFTNTSTINKP